MSTIEKVFNKIIIITAVLCCILGICLVSANRTAYAADELDYDSLIWIENGENGYTVRNHKSTPIEKSGTVSEIIEEIIENSTRSPYIVFNLSSCNEEITLNVPDGKNLALAGNIISSISEGAAFTLESGTVYLAGLSLDAAVTGFVVNRGTSFFMNSGRITVNSSSGGAALEVNGTANISGGKIEYSALSTAFGYGIFIPGEDATVTIEKSIHIQIEGHSGIEIGSGYLNIVSADVIKANKTGADNSSAGFALSVSGAGRAVISGGNFTTLGGSAVYLRGNRNSSLEIEGGSFTGGIKIVAGASMTTLKLNGRYYTSGAYHDVNINAEGGVFTAGTTAWEDVEISVSPAYQTNGYRVAGWKWAVDDEEGSRTDTEITAETFDAGVLISPLESNLYYVRYYDAKGVFIEEDSAEYGSYYDITGRVTPRTGFEFFGWSDALDGEEVYSDMIFIDKDYGLYKVERLKAPSLNDIPDAETVFGADAICEIIPSHELEDVEYSFVWQKKINGTFEDIADETNSTLTLSCVADSGVYRVKITTEHSGFTTVSYSEEINVTINKARYEHISYPEAITGTYDSEKTLEDYTLSSFFRWKDAEMIPTCDVTLYDAYYNADEDNYEDFELQISLILSKAVYDAVSNHSGFIGYLYDPTRALKEFLLDENYYWANPEEIPTCGKSEYDAYYNADPANFENKEITITVSLNRINYSEAMRNCVVYTYFRLEEGLSLNLYDMWTGGDIPEGYSLEMTTNAMRSYFLLPRGEPYEITDCSYDLDPENYYKMTGVTISVYVEKGYHEDITHSALSGVYNAQKTLADYELEEGFRWEDPTIVPTCDVRFYAAIYNDPQNGQYFNDYELIVEIDLEKGSYDPATILHPVLTGVYSPAQTLAAFSLQEHFRWVNPETVPTVNVTQYAVVYNADSVNYEDCLTAVTLILGRATYDLSGISLPDKTVVYDGKQHFLGYEGVLPQGIVFDGYSEYNGAIDSGTYPVSLHLKQEDTTNYWRIAYNISGVLTILKAPSIIEAEERQCFVYDGQIKRVNARVLNTEQSLIYSVANSFREKGSYTVILSTAESTNYLGGEKIVTVFINSPVKQIGDPVRKSTPGEGKVAFGTIENPSGIECDVDVVMEYENDTRGKILKVGLYRDGQPYGAREETYTITALLPAGLRNRELKVYYVGDDGATAEVNYRINGSCLIIETDRLGNFAIKPGKTVLKWWAWTLLGISIAAVAGTGIYFLVRYADKISGAFRRKNDIIQSETGNRDE